MSIVYSVFSILLVFLLKYSHQCDPGDFLRSWGTYQNSSNSQIFESLVSEIIVNPNVFKFEVSEKNFSELCYKTIKDLKRLNQINLERNSIREVALGSFLNLPSLRLINLKRNKIEVIQEGAFNNLDLSYLILDHNVIRHIEEKAFDGMKNLRALHLNSNKLTEINKSWFKNCVKLSYLNLEDNQFTTIPASAFQNLHGRHIYANNYETNLDLFLGRNKIISIDGKAFEGLEGLGELSLDDNEIQTLEDGLFSHFKFFRSFNIGSNKLRCLGSNLEGVLVAKENFLDGNPWDCDCLKNIEAHAERKNIEVIVAFASRQCRNGYS